MSNLPRSLTFLLVSTLCIVACGLALAASPVATDDTVSTQLNTATLIDVLANDTSDPGVPLVSSTVNVKRPFRRGILAQRDGKVSYTPQTGFIGDEIFTYTVRDSLGFISNVATVTVTVNGAPTDIALSATTVSENQPAGFVVGIFTTTDPNSADTQTYTLATGAGGTDNGSFQISGNLLQTAASLDFETKSTYSIRVRSTDSGSGNLFFEKVFTITVTNANDAPVFTAGPNQAVNEDAGLQTVNGWATGIDDGDSTLTQAVTFNIVSNSNSALFSLQPTISPAGDLLYTPAPNANGTATISVQLTDNGSNVAPNVNQSAIQTFTITVNAVNDAPSFTKGSDISVAEDTGAQTVSGWASAINDGDPETDQTLVFSITGNSNPALFSVAPSVNPANGTLTFTPANNANGSATITLRLNDNGGTANGGIDVSSTQSFIINVTPVNDPPLASAQSYNAHTNIGVRFSGLLTGAVDPDAADPGFTSVIQLNSVTPCAGCTVSIADAAAGTVDFIPPPGATGNVSFSYTVIDNGNPGSATSSPATVTVNIAGPVIWFVDDTAVAGGNGTLNKPFQTLTAAANVDSINETVFLFSGNYSNGYVLLTGEKLIGQGTTGTTFDSLLGITPPEDARHDSTDRPVINGVRPVVQDTIMLASSSLVRGLDIAASTNAGLTDTSGATTSVNVSETAVSSASNTAVSFNDLSGTVNLTNTNSTGGVNNVSLTAISGTVSLGGGSLTNASGTSFLVSGGSGTISYSGSVTKTNAQRIVDIQTTSGGGVTLSGNLNCTTCLGINLSGNTGGTHTFSGTSKLISTGTNAGVTVANNNGATVNFTGGGLAVTTTSGTGFNATGGATGINVTGSGNTLSSTTGAALNVVSTNIGSSGLTFQSISSNGAASGIVLNGTGALGGLTVTGDAGSANNSSGGTIQNATGAGVSLTNTQNVSFDQMNIQSTGNSGVNGTTVNNFAFTNGTINNAGNALNEGCITFNNSGTNVGNNIAGTLTVTGSTLTNMFTSGIEVQSDNGTVTNAVITGNTITSTATPLPTQGGGDGIKLIGIGNTITAFNLNKATISNNTISNFSLPFGGGIQVNISNSNAGGPGATAGIPGDVNNVISITGNIIRGVNNTTKMNTSAIIYAVSGGNSSLRSRGNADISNNGTALNPLTNMTGSAILLGNNGFSTMTVATNNNVIVSNNSLGSNGIGGGNGIVTVNGTGTPDMTVTATGNNITQTDGNDILLVGRGTLAGIAKFGIRNNTVAAPLGGVRQGIRVDAGNTGSVDDAVCLSISGNTSAGSTQAPNTASGIGLRKQGTVATTNDFGLVSLTPSPTGTPNVENLVHTNNPGSASGNFTLVAGSGTDLISASSGFTSCSSAP